MPRNLLGASVAVIKCAAVGIVTTACIVHAINNREARNV